MDVFPADEEHVVVLEADAPVAVRVEVDLFAVLVVFVVGVKFGLMGIFGVVLADVHFAAAKQRFFVCKQLHDEELGRVHAHRFFPDENVVDKEPIDKAIVINFTFKDALAFLVPHLEYKLASFMAL
jgi:hypothetical protein